MIEKLVDLLGLICTGARKSGYFELADMIRDKLAEMDVVLEDCKDRITWSWK